MNSSHNDIFYSLIVAHKDFDRAPGDIIIFVCGFQSFIFEAEKTKVSHENADLLIFLCHIENGLIGTWRPFIFT